MTLPKKEVSTWKLPSVVKLEKIVKQIYNLKPENPLFPEKVSELKTLYANILRGYAATNYNSSSITIPDLPSAVKAHTINWIREYAVLQMSRLSSPPAYVSAGSHFENIFPSAGNSFLK